MANQKPDWVLIFFEFSFLALGFFAGSIAEDFLNLNISAKLDALLLSDKLEASGIQDIVSSCSNLSVTSTSFCIANTISDFYKYNISNLKKDLTFEELKEQGGVCRHYANLVSDVLNELNINNTEISYYTGDLGHVFVLAYSKTSYCVIDGKEAICSVQRELNATEMAIVESLRK